MDFSTWHDHMTRPVLTPPPRQTPGDLRRMDQPELIAYADSVCTHFGALRFDLHSHRPHKDRLRAILRSNAASEPGAKAIPVITGPAGIGKSSLVRTALRERYQQQLAAEFEPEARQSGQVPFLPADAKTGVRFRWIPQVYLNLTGETRAKALDAQVLHWYGRAADTGRPDWSYRLEVIDCVKRHQTQEIILDDSHSLVVGPPSITQVMSNHIKALVTNAGEHQATVILIGVSDLIEPLFEDPQLKERARRIDVRPLNLTSGKARGLAQQDFMFFVTAARQYLPDLTLDDVLPLWTMAEKYSDGILAPLHAWFTAAVRDALLRRAATINPRHVGDLDERMAHAG